MTRLSCIGHGQAYFIVLCMGYATLLPWNAAINAFDFFDESLGTDFNFWFSGAYVWPQVVMLGIVVKLAHLVPFTTRLTWSLGIAGALTAVFPFLVARAAWSAPSLIVLAAMLAINTGILMPSSIAFAAQFPRVFSQGLMTGQGLSGIVAGFMRIGTQAIWPDSLRTGATVFFCVSAATVFVTLLLYAVLLRSEFAQSSLHHDWLRNAPLSKEPLLPGARAPQDEVQQLEDPVATQPMHSDGDDTSSNGSALLTTSSLNGDVHVAEEGVHVKSAEGQDVFIPPDLDLPHDSSQYILQVFLRIWRACSGIWLCYFLTFLVFPAALSSIEYKHSLGVPFLQRGGNWQVLLIMTFNVFDTAGRFLPGYVQLLSYRSTLFAGGGRAVFVAGILWAAQGWGGGLPDWALLCVLVLFSITNGYVTTSVMMLGPREVGLADREAAGGLLTFCLLFGMFSGTMVSLSLR